MLPGFNSAVGACAVCPEPETCAVATQGLDGGSPLLDSTQQSKGHQKQRVGDRHSPGEGTNQALPIEMDQSLPTTEHSALGTPVSPLI